MVSAPTTRLLIIVLAAFLAISMATSCMPGSRRGDKKSTLENTITLYLRALQEKNWRDVRRFWAPIAYDEYNKWKDSLPTGVRFANLEAIDVVEHQEETKATSSYGPDSDEKEKAKKLPPKATAIISAERYADNSISVKKEEWEQTWMFDQDKDKWWLVKQKVGEPK